jgi:GT2 family glycosyltransferase
MSKIGLVTVLYKSDDVLTDFFKSLSNQTYKDYHLYLINNSPSDFSDKLIENLVEEYPVSAYTYIKNTDNFGVAKGNNQGIEMALADNADYVLLLNNDIEFTQTYLLEQIVHYSIQNGEHLVIPKIFYHGTRRIWMAGGKLLKNKGITKHFGIGKLDEPKYNIKGYFEYAPTCFMLISKTVFEKIGLMDEKYFVYYDDTDFIYRAIKDGFKIFYVPELEVFHKVSYITGGGKSLFGIYYGNRNRIYFISKNFQGINYLISMLYTTFTFVIKLLIYKKEHRKFLIKGTKEGWKL